MPCYAFFSGKKRQITAETAKMAKLGDFEFPEITLTESVELARRVYEELGGEVRRDGLAMILDMSPTGGAYGAKVGALRLWGLATGRSIIRLTGDAVRVVSASESVEITSIMTRLARSVPLFNELAARLGDASVDQRVLTVTLQEITAAEMDEVARRIAMVERIFGGIREYLDKTDEENGAFHDDFNLESTAGSTSLRQGWLEFRYDDGSLRLRETTENLDVLIGVLEARKHRLQDDQR